MKRRRKRIINKSQIQSVLFKKSLWSVASAKDWLRKHGYKSSDIESGKTVLRFRQAPKDKFSRFGTIVWKGGIEAVVGFTGVKPNPKRKRNIIGPADRKSKHFLSKVQRKRLEFSQQTDVRVDKMNVLLPDKNEEVMLIGTAERLDYVSDKFSGVKQLYEHKLRKHGIILGVFGRNSDRIKTIIIANVNMGVGPEGLTG